MNEPYIYIRVLQYEIEVKDGKHLYLLKIKQIMYKIKPEVLVIIKWKYLML